MPPEEQIAAAAAAGFEGIELALTYDGPLRVDSPSALCATRAATTPITSPCQSTSG